LYIECYNMLFIEGSGMWLARCWRVFILVMGVCLFFVFVVSNDEMRLLEENSSKLKLWGDISVASLPYEFSSARCCIKSTCDPGKYLDSKSVKDKNGTLETL
jgi:hypothetical protein